MVGFGAIGGQVCRVLQAGIPGLKLEAVSRRGLAEAVLGEAGVAMAVTSVADLIRRCAVVVDCAPASAFEEIAVLSLGAGRTLVTVNAGAMLELPWLAQLAQMNGGRIVLVSGAVAGLDGVRAAAESGIRRAGIITRKPPASLAKSGFVRDQGVDFDRLDAPLQLYAGSVREGVRRFPANTNVAAALALAGIGADRTTMEVWADPGVNRNTHFIEVDAECGVFTVKIANQPMDENPATARIAPLSVITALRSLVSPLTVGS